MPKLPDFSKLTEKLDIKGVMDSVKSIISPGSVIPENIEGEPIAAKLAMIVTAMQTISSLHSQQEQEITKVNSLIASIYKDMSAAKAPSSSNPLDDQPLK